MRYVNAQIAWHYHKDCSICGKYKLKFQCKDYFPIIIATIATCGIGKITEKERQVSIMRLDITHLSLAIEQQQILPHLRYALRSQIHLLKPDTAINEFYSVQEFISNNVIDS